MNFHLLQIIHSQLCVGAQTVSNMLLKCDESKRETKISPPADMMWYYKITIVAFDVLANI